MRHALPILLWNSNSLLKWAFDRGEEPPVIQQPDLHLAGPLPPQEKEDGVEETQAARFELERFRKDMVDLQAKMPRPLQRHVHRDMFFREFHDVVSRHWTNLGLPTDELLQIFTGSETPDESLPQDNHAAFTAPSTLSLEDIKRCNVTIYSDEIEPIRCIGYRVEEDQRSRMRVLLWYDEEEQVMMHHIPFQTHPYTYHAKYAHDVYKVQFLQKHKTLVQRYHQVSQPIYSFANDIDCESFQRFVRNRELLGTFDVHSIKSDCDKLAELQHLKVWRLDGADNQPTLSFFADRLDLYENGSGSSPAVFCELPLRCFEPVPRHESPRTLKLMLNKMRAEVEPQSPKRRLSILGRRRSSSKASPTSPRSSISVEYAETIYDNVNSPLLTTDEMYADMQHIDIEFTNTTDVYRFIRTCRNAHPRSSFGSQLSVPWSESTSPIAASPTPSHTPWHTRTPSVQLEPDSLHYRSRSTSSNLQLFMMDPVHAGSSAANSYRSTTTSMPPTPALTEQSVETNNTGASVATLQTPPSLPELHMPPSFHSFQWKHDEDYGEPRIS
ncbi:hypothetical protein BDV96DRAFT_94578 [Lophiotrema nucula]|uniref:Uncharacterized protein n=1 Tax=Lophiotrema nucula TaxID=690887 RepID=A0A6A5Z494_9PLEO|nr:hypothetical protein BDV96DRAFT_94578 [Lophiotrema nucula]